MCTRVKRRVRWVALLIAMSSLIAVSAAANNHGRDDDKSVRGEDRWVPAFAIAGAFHGQGQKSDLQSSCDVGGPGADAGSLVPCSQAGPGGRNDPLTLYPDPNPLRNPADGKEFGFWPGVGIDVHLMSPQIDVLPMNLGPRVFVNGEVMAVFPPERSTANEGSLTGLAFPEQLRDLTQFPAGAIGGVGTKTTSKADTFEYGAQVGLSFPLDIYGRRMRIKPSFGWLRYTIDITGSLLAALKDDFNGVALDRTYGPNSRIIDIEKRISKDINAIGPGIEVELESGQFGPIGAAVFASAHGYKVLGDREFRIRESVTFPGGGGGPLDPGPDGLAEDTYRAEWNHEIKPWVYKLKMGIRFHYLGK